MALLALCLGCLVLFVGWARFSPPLVNSCSALLHDSLRCASGVSKIRIYAFTLALFPLILLLERWRPADPSQPAFSAGLVVDCWWFLAFPLLGVWLPALFEDFLDKSFHGGPQLHFFTGLPVIAQLVVAIMLSDLMAYVSHYIRHKVWFLWEFHKIHHSQVQLNYFSTVRLHPLDLVAGVFIRFLPFALLGVDLAIPAFIGWIAFQRFYEMFVHANIHTNMGWLRYVLVTPQSHRIHHSLEREHIDTNFGNIFSIWDNIFGTQIHDSTAYPALGVDDAKVPLSPSAGLFDTARTFLKELVYPLIALARPRR